MYVCMLVLCCGDDVRRPVACKGIGAIAARHRGRAGVRAAVCEVNVCVRLRQLAVVCVFIHWVV